MRFEAVLFDFDGVMVDTEWSIYEAWQETFAREGQELPLEMYTRCIGSDFETWSPKRYLEELTGRVYPWEEMDQARQVVIRRSLEASGLMPGVEGLLGWLEGRRVPRGVVSSSSHGWVDGWLERLGVIGRLSPIVCRGDAPRIKPAPDLWEEAVRRLGTEAGRILAIEDSLNGVRSARAAGLEVWVVPNRTTACLDFGEAHRVWGSMDELWAALERGE